MSRPIYQGKRVNLSLEEVPLPNGNTIDLEVFYHPGASAIVSLDDERRVTLIRQYRFAAGGYLWEVPAGTLEPGEPPAECARRELKEEAGLVAERWEYLGKIWTVPSFCTEVIHLFLAEGLTGDVTAHEHDEVIDAIEAVPLEEALGWIREGMIVDAKSIAALHHAALHRGVLRRGGA